MPSGRRPLSRLVTRSSLRNRSWPLILTPRSFAALLSRRLSLVSSCYFQRGHIWLTLFISCYAAQKGSGAYLLKAGSKRRRKQADIPGQILEQEMADLQVDDQSQRIAQLEQELARVNEEASQGKMALDALNEGLRMGELEQNMDGSISASKHRPGNANVIGNLDEL